jgi:hypothetical protein
LREAASPPVQTMTDAASKLDGADLPTLRDASDAELGGGG